MTEINGIPISNYSKVACGGSIRFQVRDEILGNGSTWKIRTSKNQPDVYVIHRDSAKWMKASFHEEVGRSHYAVTKAGLEIFEDNSEPYLSVSYSREEFAPGWFHAKRIIVAKDELRKWAEPELIKNLKVVDFNHNYDAIAIDLLLGKPSVPPLVMQSQVGREILGVLSRCDGGLATVMATPIKLDYVVQERLSHEISQASDDLKSLRPDGTPTRFVVIIENDDNGTQKEIEVALDNYY